MVYKGVNLYILTKQSVILRDAKISSQVLNSALSCVLGKTQKQTMRSFLEVEKYTWTAPSRVQLSDT